MGKTYGMQWQWGGGRGGGSAWMASRIAWTRSATWAQKIAVAQQSNRKGMVLSESLKNYHWLCYKMILLGPPDRTSSSSKHVSSFLPWWDILGKIEKASFYRVGSIDRKGHIPLSQSMYVLPFIFRNFFWLSRVCWMWLARPWPTWSRWIIYRSFIIFPSCWFTHRPQSRGQNEQIRPVSGGAAILC